MNRTIAIEEGVSNHIKATLQGEGYKAVKPGSGGKVDATIVSGMDDNVMGIHDIQGKSAVIEAAGKTDEQILKELRERL